MALRTASATLLLASALMSGCATESASFDAPLVAARHEDTRTTLFAVDTDGVVTQLGSIERAPGETIAGRLMSDRYGVYLVTSDTSSTPARFVYDFARGERIPFDRPLPDNCTFRHDQDTAGPIFGMCIDGMGTPLGGDDLVTVHSLDLRSGAIHPLVEGYWIVRFAGDEALVYPWGQTGDERVPEWLARDGTLRAAAPELLWDRVGEFHLHWCSSGEAGLACVDRYDPRTDTTTRVTYPAEPSGVDVQNTYGVYTWSTETQFCHLRRDLDPIVTHCHDFVQAPRIISSRGGALIPLRFSADLDRLLVLDDAYRTHVIDTRSGAARELPDPTPPFYQGGFSADGELFMISVGAHDGRRWLLDLERETATEVRDWVVADEWDFAPR